MVLEPIDPGEQSKVTHQELLVDSLQQIACLLVTWAYMVVAEPNDQGNVQAVVLHTRQRADNGHSEEFDVVL